MLQRAKSLTVDQNEDDNEEESDPQNASYDYLLSMPLWSLTHEKVEELQLEKGNHEDKVRTTFRTHFTHKCSVTSFPLSYIAACEAESHQRKRALGGRH